MEVDDISGVDDSFCIDFGVPDSLIEYSEEHLSSEENNGQEDFQIEDKYEKNDELMEEERLEMDDDEIDETEFIKTEPQKRISSVQVLRPKTTAMSGPPLIRNIGVQQNLSQHKPPVKIAAKSSTTVTTKPSGGQILIIQSPNGTQQTIRLSGANAQNLSSGGYQLIKTPEGNLIQIRKKNNQTNLKELATPPEVIKKIGTQQQKPSSNAVGKLIYKGINVKGNEQHVMLSTAPTKLPATIVTSTNGTTTTQTKTLSLNDVQQLRLMNSGTAVKQVIVTHKGKDGSVQNLRTMPRTVSSGQNSPNAPSPRVLTNAIKKVTPIQPKLPISTTITKTAPIIKKVS